MAASARRKVRHRGGRQGNQSPAPRDLILGLVAPMGVDCTPVFDALLNELRIVRYDAIRVKISQQLEKFLKEAKPSILTGASYLERKRILMDAGNALRHLCGSGNALAFLAMTRIAQERRNRPRGQTGNAFIIDSLKHPSEIDALKSVYGPAFVAIGVYSPRSTRFEYIEGQRSLLKDIDRERMEELILRDQDEEDRLGQRVRAAFELTDVVIDARHSEMPLQVRRLIELLFGNKLKTPTVAEYGMAVAHAAQARSGSLARQIGAVILRTDGSVVAIGRNDVARPGGGQYEEADDSDFPRGRDIRLGSDSSDFFRQRVLADIIRLLQEESIIRESEDPQKLFEKWYFRTKANPRPFLRRSLLLNTIDYIRAVHAEMAALLDAARSGTSVAGATLYTTTFPCHDCAKAIIASGIAEVVYWAPYPKSLVDDLYEDSIDVDVPEPNSRRVHFHSFVGIAPNRYPDFFIMGKRERKLDNGKAEVFTPMKARLTLPDYAMPEQLSLLYENSEVRSFLRKFAILRPSRLARLRKIKKTDDARRKPTRQSRRKR